MQGWRTEAALGWAHCWSSYSRNSFIWKSLAIFLPLGWGCYVKAWKESAFVIKVPHVCRAAGVHEKVKQVLGRGLFPGSERQYRELRLHNILGEQEHLGAAQVAQNQAVSPPWARTAAAVAGGQCQHTSVQCSVSSQLGNKSPVFRNALEIQCAGATKPQQSFRKCCVLNLTIW